MVSNLEPRNSKLETAFEIPDRVLVVGMGKTGISLVKFLSKLGRKITATDTKAREELASSLADLNGTPYEGHFGAHVRDDFLNHQMIVISPGVNSDLPLLEEARSRGSKVIGEIELAARFIKEPIVAVTGTNGKTTTTTLLGEVFSAAFGDVFVGGNIGNPLIEYVSSGRRARFVIAEISSFQLETIETFRPSTAILLNITEDHLDRYTSFDEYAAAKWRIFENQTPDDAALITRALAGKDGAIRARRFYFSTDQKLDEGAFLDGNTLCVRLKGSEYRYPRDLSPLVGIHNSENLLSVLLTSHLHAIPQPIVEKVLKGFKGLHHRMEFVREKAGAKFYNDSKATNVDATKRALESMAGNVILIAGGKDKGGSYQVITRFSDRIKSLILFGEAREKIASELSGHMPTHQVATLSDAVEKAFSLAGKGETILFSPMCSSFDMFRDYKDRGDRFRAIVEAL
jgi:UDP-N-acetylmuramoylalanine--D-glutamate ligase